MPIPQIVGSLLISLAMIGGAAADDHGKPTDPHLGMDMSHVMHLTAPSFAAVVGAPGNASEITRTIAIVMGDASFAPDSIVVQQGEVIRFVVKNESAADHEFVLGDAAMHAAHRAEMAKMIEAGHAMHHENDGAEIAVAAGETKELIWRFAAPATLEFACNIPGHYEAGMKGDIIVAP